MTKLVNANEAQKTYGTTVHVSEDEYIDPAEYGIDIFSIRKQIEDMAKGDKDDTRPEERYTQDVVEKYQSFAEEHLGFRFNDVKLFITALTHRSYVNEHRNVKVEHNERLEFLGDAILEQVTSEFLFRYFDEPEGLMTAWRSSLVRTESIGAASIEIGYVPLVRLSKGERSNVGRSHDNIIADCFEAVTGAIFIDQGYAAAKRHIYKHILCKMPQILDAEAWRDPKSHLQEMTQKTLGVIPQYRLVKVDGPDHAHVFTIELTVGGEVRGRGTGNSKQSAQAAAAREAIKYFKSLDNVSDDGKLSSSNL